MRRNITKRDIKDFNILLGLFSDTAKHMTENYNTLSKKDEDITKNFYNRISAGQEFPGNIDRLKSLNEQITTYIQKFDKHKYFL